MRPERVDLRSDGREVRSPPVSSSVSVIIAIALSLSGIAFTAVGLFFDEGPQRITPSTDIRPYLLLSSTIDMISGTDNSTYENLPISTLIYLMLIGEVETDLNITNRVQNLAAFLYEDATGISMDAYSEGLGDLTLFSTQGIGEPMTRTASMTVSGRTILVTLEIWRGSA